MEFIINGDTINVEKINNDYVFQGDILLTEEQLTNSDTLKGAGGTFFVETWKNNTVYYIIDNEWLDKEQVEMIRNAIEYVEQNTIITFKEEIDGPNYIVFKWENDKMASCLGMKGGSQELFVADGAKLGNVIHEIGHALGLIHEHSRWDRNKSIIVHKNNIKEDKLHQYDKILDFYRTSDFDFGSIMLYGSFVNVKNPSLSALTMNDGKTTWDSPRKGLSFGDIIIITAMYQE